MFAPLTKTVQVGMEATPSSMAWDPDTLVNYEAYDPEFDPEPWSFDLDNQVVTGVVDIQATGVTIPTKWYFEIEWYVVNEDHFMGVYCDCGIGNINDLSILGIGLEYVYPNGSSEHLKCYFNNNNNEYRHDVSLDGINNLTFYTWDDFEGTVFQFAGDQTDIGSGHGKLWFGVNNQWLSIYYPDEWVWDEELEEEVLIPEHWGGLGDPETGANPSFSNLDLSLYPTLYHSQATWVEEAQPKYHRLRTKTADLLYTPPTGFSTLSSTATEMTLDPAQKTVTCEVTNGDLTATGTSAVIIDQIRSLTVVGNDAWYVELNVDALPNSIALGVATGDFTITDPFMTGGFHWILYQGDIYPSSSSWFANVDTVSVFRIAFREGKLWFGTDVHGWRGNPVTGETPAFMAIPTPLYIVVGVAENATATFVPSDFTFDPPAGFTQPTLGELVTLTVLRDLVIQPIVQPTQHHLMGYAGL